MLPRVSSTFTVSRFLVSRRRWLSAVTRYDPINRSSHPIVVVRAFAGRVIRASCNNSYVHYRNRARQRLMRNRHFALLNSRGRRRRDGYSRTLASSIIIIQVPRSTRAHVWRAIYRSYYLDDPSPRTTTAPAVFRSFVAQTFAVHPYVPLARRIQGVPGGICQTSAVYYPGDFQRERSYKGLFRNIDWITSEGGKPPTKNLYVNSSPLRV